MFRSTLFVILLACILFSACVPGEKIYRVEKSANGKGVFISQYLGNDAVVHIPPKIGGELVLGISESAFYQNTTLASVIIPGSVKLITQGAFEGCTGLTNIIFSEGVRYIGGFKGCTALRSVVFPEGAQSIGGFYGCTNLATVSLPENLEVIKEYAFYNCSSLTTLVLPASIQAIVANAFRGCSSLTTVVIPDTVKSINFYLWALSDRYPFGDCPKLSPESKAALRARGWKEEK